MNRAAIAALVVLTACGEHAQVLAPPDDHSVCIGEARVSPSSVTLSIGGMATLTASVTGADCRLGPVIWTSSNATIAAVTQSGVVTGVKDGVVTVTASSVADQSVKGAAVVAVGDIQMEGGVVITFVNAISAGGQSLPVNILAVAGTVDVGVNVQPPKSATTVTAIIWTGLDSLVQTQTVNPIAGATSPAQLTFRFNTAAADSATGTRLLHNGLATLKVVAMSSSQTASSSITFMLANP